MYGLTVFQRVKAGPFPYYGYRYLRRRTTPSLLRAPITLDARTHRTVHRRHRRRRLPLLPHSITYRGPGSSACDRTERTLYSFPVHAVRLHLYPPLPPFPRVCACVRPLPSIVRARVSVRLCVRVRKTLFLFINFFSDVVFRTA